MNLVDFATNRRLQEERRARDDVLSLLSEDELVIVGRAPPGGEGEEHLGLDQRGRISVSSRGSLDRCPLLARTSVELETWNRIIAALAAEDAKPGPG